VHLSEDLSVFSLKTSLLVEPLWKVSSNRCIRRLMRMVEFSRRPYPEARLEIASVVDDFERQWRMNETMSILLLRMVPRALDEQAVVQAGLAVKRTGLEWEIARARQGSYPAAPAVADPFTGNPLIADLSKGILSSAGPPAGSAERLEADELTWKLRKHDPK